MLWLREVGSLAQDHAARGAACGLDVTLLAREMSPGEFHGRNDCCPPPHCPSPHCVLAPGGTPGLLSIHVRGYDNSLGLGMPQHRPSMKERGTHQVRFPVPPTSYKRGPCGPLLRALDQGSWRKEPHGNHLPGLAWHRALHTMARGRGRLGVRRRSARILALPFWGCVSLSWVINYLGGQRGLQEMGLPLLRPGPVSYTIGDVTTKLQFSPVINQGSKPLPLRLCLSVLETLPSTERGGASVHLHL